MSFLLLMMVFRSVVVPLKAVIMNLLASAAAFGVLALAVSGGPLGDLVGIPEATPVPILLPIGIFAILFGLSMDYEVFLLSRIKEEYDRTGDNALAVADGLAKSARVITAGAAVMVTVFLSFVLGEHVFGKMFGIGLAAAVLIDATIVRMVLVPATMELLGDRNWWLPGWLDRLLPNIHVEGHEVTDDEHRSRPSRPSRPFRVPAGADPHDHRRGLTRRYGDFTAVDDVSFTAQPVGSPDSSAPTAPGSRPPCGSWSGSPEPRRGRVTIAGRRYVDLPNPGLEVGVLLDASAQHAGRTGREILDLAQRFMGLPRSRVEEMLEVVSLTPAEASRRVGNYSLGMRQRLGIATALIGDPEVLILDEPANGLDPAGIRWMRDLLRGYADRGGTVLLSSHLLHEIEVIADDIVMIGNGRIVSQGTKTELLHAAGTVVRAEDLDRARARTRPSGTRHAARPGTVPCAPTRTPTLVGQGGAGGRCRADRAARRRRRPGGHVPRAHRRPPSEKEQRHDRHRRRAASTGATRSAIGCPLTRLTAGRAAQDVRHPLRLLADRQHRHHRRPGHRRRHPLGPGRPADLLHLRHRDPLPRGGHPAADRDPGGHQRVEPTHRAHHVHPGPAPRPDHRGQGHLLGRSSPSPRWR